MLLPLLLGQGTAGPTSYTLSVDPTSYSSTFSSVTLSVGRQVDVSATSYNYTYTNPTLVTAKQLGITSTSYTNTFSNNTLVRTYVLPVTSTSYTFTDSPVGLYANRQWNVTPPNSYSISYSSVSLTTDRFLSISGDPLTVTFSNVSLDYVQSAKQILVDPFSITWTTESVVFQATRQLSVDSVTQSLSFQNPTVLADRNIQVSFGSYDILSSPVTITATRELVVYPQYQTYVTSGYVESGYVGRSNTYSLDTNYVTSGYVRPGYVSAGISGQMVARKALAPDSNSIVVGFAPVTISVINYYPNPSDVRYGVVYGPNGIYSGTMDVLSKTIKYDIVTGKLIKPLNDQVVMTL
jgi:hypothetical protein